VCVSEIENENSFSHFLGVSFTSWNASERQAEGAAGGVGGHSTHMKDTQAIQRQFIEGSNFNVKILKQVWLGNSFAGLFAKVIFLHFGGRRKSFFFFLKKNVFAFRPYHHHFISLRKSLKNDNVCSVDALLLFSKSKKTS
jgi:hypothetical protein